MRDAGRRIGAWTPVGAPLARRIRRRAAARGAGSAPLGARVALHVLCEGPGCADGAKGCCGACGACRSRCAGRRRAAPRGADVRSRTFGAEPWWPHHGFRRQPLHPWCRAWLPHPWYRLSLPHLRCLFQLLHLRRKSPPMRLRRGTATLMPKTSPHARVFNAKRPVHARTGRRWRRLRQVSARRARLSA
ncbi:hypothetical protein CSE45_2516 [Citreicella sp. SE45]|nr:hypothetical protein CSE45_2516 [Citreicella sp. SE45]